MAEIVNLRQARKRLVRAAASEAAAANRAKHGQTRAQRDAANAEAEARDRTLDGARLLRDGDGEAAE